MSGASGLRKHDHSSAGQGGAITPAIDYGEDADIVDQDYDDVADAGALDEAARADHRHGMPSAGGGGGFTPSTSALVYDDMYTAGASVVYAGGIIALVNGTGAAVAAQDMDTTEANHPGVIRISTGSTSTGYASIYNTTTVWSPTKGPMEFGLIAKAQSLSTGTHRYIVRAGFGTQIAFGATAESQGVYFRYSDDINSAKWQAVCCKDGTETTADTGITVNTNWHTFSFVVNDDATSVEFFIDTVSVATITTNIPTGNETYRWCPGVIEKTIGTSSRNFLIDAYWYSMTLNPAR